MKTDKSNDNVTVRNTLTIGIPTYNRKDYLKRVLDEFIKQIEHESCDVKVIVSDNCSTDGTEELMKKQYSKCRFLTYNRNKKNLKTRKNILKIIELAKTDYVWFFGDDDFPVPDALKRVIRLINSSKEKKIFALNARKADGQCLYFKRFSSDVDLSFQDSSMKYALKHDLGLLSELILPSQMTKEVVKKYDINHFWPHIHMIGLLMIIYDVKIRIVLQPFVIQNFGHHNLIYVHLDSLVVFYYYKLLLFENLEKEFSLNLSDVKSFLINSYEFLPSYILDAFLKDSSEDLIKEMKYMTHYKKFHLLLLPFKIPKIVRRFIVVTYCFFRLPQHKTIRRVLNQNKSNLRLLKNKKNKASRRVMVCIEQK